MKNTQVIPVKIIENKILLIRGQKVILDFHLAGPYDVENKILIIRGQRVLLDKDLAYLYGIETFNLNKAVKRNLDRFPEDFMFRLSREEFKNLIFHFGISRLKAI